MSLLDLADRLNWQQACTVLGCKKTQLYKITKLGFIKSYGASNRNRFWLKSELQSYALKGKKEN